MRFFFGLVITFVVLASAASYFFFKSYPNSSLLTENIFGEIGTAVFTNNEIESITTYVVPLSENVSQVYDLSNTDFDKIAYVSKTLDTPKDAKLIDRLSKYYVVDLNCIGTSEKVKFETCEPSNTGFGGIGVPIIVRKNIYGNLAFGIPQQLNNNLATLFGKEVKAQFDFNSIFEDLEFIEEYDFEKEMLKLEDLSADQENVTEAEEELIFVQLMTGGAAVIISQRIENAERVSVRDPLFIDFKSKGNAIVEKQKAEKEEKARQLKLKQDQLLNTPAFGEIGYAMKYDLNGEFYLRPIDDTLNELYVISDDKYSNNYWRTIRLTNVSNRGKNIERNSAYFVLLDGCINNGKPMSTKDCIASDKHPNLLLKTLEGSYSTVGTQEGLDLKDLAANPNTPISVKGIFFTAWSNLKMVSSASTSDANFLAFQARGKELNQYHALQAEQLKQKRQLESELSKPIYDLDAGDVFYLQGILSETAVSVVRVDAKSNKVKVRRHDDGTTKWVSYSELLDRDQKTANEVGRGVVGVAILACILGGCD